MTSFKNLDSIESPSCEWKDCIFPCSCENEQCQWLHGQSVAEDLDKIFNPTKFPLPLSLYLKIIYRNFKKLFPHGIFKEDKYTVADKIREIREEIHPSIEKKIRREANQMANFRYIVTNGIYKIHCLSYLPGPKTSIHHISQYNQIIIDVIGKWRVKYQQPLDEILKKLSTAFEEMITDASDVPYKDLSRYFRTNSYKSKNT